jgi:protein-S-isoprenylcysteine O-methyltransferase Ste14
MSVRLPSSGLVLITGVSMACFVGLPALGWGSLGGLLSEPARAAALAVIAAAATASLFSGIHLGGCVRADAREQWRLAPLAVISLLIAVVPAYDDRREIATLGGTPTRWAGLALVVVGAIFRVGPMFVLGKRFTWPLAGQEPDRLRTTGFYRYVRHPSYLGALVGGVGWVLVFRSGLGLVLIALLIPAFLPMIPAEEVLLLAEFGEGYRAYQRRTWRLVPFVY